MHLVLLGVGVLLLGFGVFVLLKQPTLPGGKIEFHRIKVDSVGAGLPLIVLGLAAVVIAVVMQTDSPTTPPPQSQGPPPSASGPPTPSQTSTSPSAPQTSAASPDESPAHTPIPAGSCVEEWLDQHPRVDSDDRKKMLVGREYGVFGGETVGVIVLRDDSVIGAIRLQESADETELEVVGAVDQACRPVKWDHRMVEDGYVTNDYAVTLSLQGRQYILEYTGRGSIIHSAVLRPAGG